MQQMPNLLSASGLTMARKAAYSSLSCDVGQICNSTVVELHYALLQAVLGFRLLNIDDLSQLLPAEAWGISLEPSCADGGVRLILPEPVAKVDGSAATAALFRLTLNGDAAVLNTTTLAGPWQNGGGILYVLELGPELLPSGGELLALSVEEETLVAPLRGLVPRMTLSTLLANCHAPFIVSVTALPVNESGNLAQEGWGAAVQATVGLQIVFSESVASRAEDGTLSPLDATSFHFVTPNGTRVLEVRMSTSTGARRARRQLLDVEAYVSKAVILLGLSAAPGDGEVVGLSVLEGRVVNQQGNAMVGGRILWADLQPGLPTGPGCPWLGGMVASALMAALSLLEMSLRLLPEKLRICGRRRGITRKSKGKSKGKSKSKSKYILPAPAPVVPLPRETLPSTPPASPPASPPAAPQRTKTRRKLEEAEARKNRRNGKQENNEEKDPFARVSARDSLTIDAGILRASDVIFSGAETVMGAKPKLGIIVWIISMVSSTFLVAWGSARQVTYAQTVVPLLPVWFAQGFLLSGQCSKRQSGLALLPALRTLGVCVMSIAVAFVTGTPGATDLVPLRRLMIVGPAALVAALFIAVDAVFKNRKVSGGSDAGIDASQSFACDHQPALPLTHEKNTWGFSSRRSSCWPSSRRSASSPSCLLANFSEHGVSPPPDNSVSPPPSPPGCFWRRKRKGLQALPRELGPEALKSLALLIAVLATVVGVPPFSVGDGTFACHSIPMSVFGTVTALIAPLLPGLLRRVRGRRNGQGVGKTITPTLSLGLNDAEKGGDRTAKAWRAAQLSNSVLECRAQRSSSREAVGEPLAQQVTFDGTTGNEPPDAPIKPPVAAEMLVQRCWSPTWRQVVVLQGNGTVFRAPARPPLTKERISLQDRVSLHDPIFSHADQISVRKIVPSSIQGAFQDRVQNFPSSKRSSFARFADASAPPSGVTRSLYSQRLRVPSPSDGVEPDCDVERINGVSLPAPRLELAPQCGAVGDGPDVGGQVCVRRAAAELVQWSDVYPKSKLSCSTRATTGVRVRIQPGEIDDDDDDDDDDGGTGSGGEAEAAPSAGHLRSLPLSGANPRGGSMPPPRSSKAPAISSRIPRLSNVMSQRQ